MAELAGFDHNCRAGTRLTQPMGGGAGQSLASSYEEAWTRPGPRAPQNADAAATLDGVTRLLTEQIDELAALWHDLGGQRTDVLAQDLPEWLGSALVGGKRLRPAMCHWGYVAAGADLHGPGHSEMIKAATALELLHQFASAA